MLTQPEPLRALNHGCYQVSQVLRLCCSNAAGGKTLTCMSWLLVSAGETPYIDWLDSLLGSGALVASEESGVWWFGHVLKFYEHYQCT